MNFFIRCPYCCYKLIKAEAGAIFEIVCPECKSMLLIKVTDEELNIKRVFMSQNEIE